MNVLVLGSGGREHAILKHILKNNPVSLFCVGDNRNPGILDIVKKFELYKNNDTLKRFCLENKIYFVVVGPEKYLASGVCDCLESAGIICIGPTKSNARIETDKHYARELLTQNGLEYINPKYRIFKSLETSTEIKEYYELCKSMEFNYVIKPTGLTGGKGVKISNIHFQNHLEGLTYCQEILDSKQNVIIEEKLDGNEFTLMSYTDGITTSHMPAVIDFKLLDSENSGPNTGSMGCITYSDHKTPFLSVDDINECQTINSKVVQFLGESNKTCYKGILYGGFIKCKNNTIKLIEYNARYGDPEAINCIELLKTNLLDIYKAIGDQKLSEIDIVYENTNIVSKYLVPDFYPDLKDKKYVIDFNWYTKNKNNIIFASVNKHKKEVFYSTKSRSIVFFKKGEDINQLSIYINEHIKHSNFKFRKDIGLLNKIDYTKSGVDIDLSARIIRNLSSVISHTHNENCLHRSGAFNGCVKLSNYKSPVLISSIDGVGTKPSFLCKITHRAYNITGQDIVAHSINDILVQRAKPLYFLDYIACDHLNPKNIEDVIKGISKICKKYSCPLIGGETAEMPDTYNKHKIDVAGCITGVAEEENLIDGKKNITIGDHVIGLYSEGLHTNGFSLIRKLFTEPQELEEDFKEWLCQPHKCYLDEITLLDEITIHGMVHITGGGIIENPPRVLPKDTQMCIFRKYLFNNYFNKIQDTSSLDETQMLKIFNCGIGFMIILDDENYHKLEDIYTRHNITFCKLGYITKKNNDNDIIII